MEKEKYLYLILDEFYNAKKLREDYINQKEFYKKINGNNDVIRNLDNNINLFNKTIEYLENLIYLPIHEMIKNMSNNELLNYKKDILSKENNVIFKEQNKIEELKKEIKELNIDIENISYNYSKYKREKVLDEKQLDFYVSDCKEKLQEIEEINNEIKEIECNMSNMLSKKNTLETLTLEEFRKYLIDYYGINNIELELDKYKVNRTDEIVVDLCSDLNILDSVKELINKYISLRDKSIKKTIKMPKEFNDYKVENKTYLNDFILTSCFHSSYDKSTNEIDILNEKDMYVMKEKVDAVISEIDKSKNNLIDFKLKCNEMSKISFNTINEKTIDYILSLCDSLYLTENVKNDIKSLFKSYKKWHTKFYNIFNNALYLDYIEKELFFKINNILNDYWDSLCDELESILNGVNSNTEFIDNLSIYNINKNIKNNIIFDRNHFSEIGLLNMRLLIENMLNKYNELANQLYSFGNDLMYFKDDMIESKNNKEKELNLIKIKIDSLYYKVCPNNYSILVSDYDSLYKIFRDQTLIDSIVKINRRNLISKVRSECVNYKDKNIEILKDIEIIKKKVLNNK